MPRIYIAGLLGLIAVSVAGCGGSSGSKQADAISHTYISYFEALKSGDGKAACELLTPAYQRRASKLVNPVAQSRLRGASCPKAITAGTLPQLKGFQPKLEQIHINGDRASGFTPSQGAFGPAKTLFRRIGRDWKISATVYQRGAHTAG